jgi:hypothetical protein
MKIWQGMMCSAALALMVLGPAGAASAVSVSGRASTVLEWFDDANGDTAIPLYQYLQLNVLNLADGYDFRLYGRVGDDIEGRRIGGRAESRLYFAYLEKRNIVDNLDFRLGRQFISTTAGATVMDGLRLDYRLLDNYRLSLFGGGDVAYYEGYNLKDAIVGGEIAGRFIDDLHLGLSYVARVDGGNLGQELFGLNAAYDWNQTLYLYSETQYDYLSKRVSYFLAGTKYHAPGDWTARAEYLYSLPVFSSKSIYSVFAADEYEEIMGELTYAFGNGLRAFGRYTREMYVDFSDANVFMAGIEKLRTNRCSGYITGVYRDDSDGQDLKGVKIYGNYLFNRYLQAGLGADIDVLERRLNYFDDEPSDETTAKRFWADVTVFATDTINVQAKVERIESDLWNYYNRGRIRLNVLF